MTPKRPVYPFAALVGQERLKLALVLNAINPLLGGVLIRGEKGRVEPALFFRQKNAGKSPAAYSYKLLKLSESELSRRGSLRQCERHPTS